MFKGQVSYANDFFLDKDAASLAKNVCFTQPGEWSVRGALLAVNAYYNWPSGPRPIVSLATYFHPNGDKYLVIQTDNGEISIHRYW